jgi:hypothetical protein
MPSRLAPVIRLKVRHVRDQTTFPLARGLPSTTSAARGVAPPSLVRQLHRYYAAIRLPAPSDSWSYAYWLHHAHCTCTHILVRCSHSRQTGSPGSRQVVSEHDEVSDRAGSRYTSPKRCTRCCLRHDLTASAPRTKVISRLNTQPARAPVNASSAPLPPPTHDSGSPWIATPSACDSFLHYNSPVSRRTRPNPSLKRSANGRPPSPGRWYAVHFHQPGPGVLPLSPA